MLIIFSNKPNPNLILKSQFEILTT